MKKLLFVPLAFMLVLSACKRDEEPANDTTPPAPELNSSTPVLGYGMLDKIRGIWSGPLSSTTALGGFPDWTVDLRPIAPSQISSKSELDSLNDIFMSFFLTKYNNEYRIAFRNGGGFSGSQRISYLLCDSVYEDAQTSYYRYSDFVMGIQRAYSEFTFRNDSLYMKTYTNHYNTTNPAQLHMSWNAVRKDTTSQHAADSIHHFPQKELRKDLSTAFNSMTESIFYSANSDPYPEADQPYLGKTTVNITYSGVTMSPGTNSFIIFTTQPLFSGFTFNSANLKYRSRYVMLPITDGDYTFTYMHPGTYWAYVLHDENGDGNFSTGDHMNSPLSPITFTLGALGNQTVNITVGFTIP